MSNHLFDALAAPAAGRDKTAIELADGKHVSYGDLFDLVGRLASHLVRSGVKPGDRVAVQVEKSWQNLALYLACVRAGAVFLPLNTAYQLAEVEYFLSDAEPRFVVCRPESEKGIRPLCQKLGEMTVESLGTSGDGSLLEAAAGASSPS